MWTATVGALPVGAVVRIGSEAHLVQRNGVRPFGFDGWGALVPSLSDGSPVDVLTPRLSVEALRRGYRPVLHRSAGSVD